jgi:3',5'-cyclic AMP phosphodiesterase CpdA
MRLLAISDLHISHRGNREALLELPEHRDDWLIVAGDVSERADHLTLALDALTSRFARVIWTPGNHDLWITPGSTNRTRGEDRYRELVEICRRFGVTTPEDDYLEWPGAPGTYVVPMFLLFDYTFRPPEIDVNDAVQWARSHGVVSGDERMLATDPWPTLPAWCEARCVETERRLTALPADAETVLINHWPLRYDLSRPPRVPPFSVWSGTSRTEDWARRFRARVVISGHLHLRTTLWRHGVRYDEVSLGYPRDWHRERGIEWYLRDVLPADAENASRFVPPRDPFFR